MEGQMQIITPLYKIDFYAWTQQQAALLQAEELEKLDLPNLAEEDEGVYASVRLSVAAA